MPLAEELHTYPYEILHDSIVRADGHVTNGVWWEEVTAYTMLVMEVDEIVYEKARSGMHHSLMISLKTEFMVAHDGDDRASDTGAEWEYINDTVISETHWLKTGHVAVVNEVCKLCRHHVSST
jgi:hypothetical protein